MIETTFADIVNYLMECPDQVYVTKDRIYFIAEGDGIQCIYNRSKDFTKMTDAEVNEYIQLILQ